MSCAGLALHCPWPFAEGREPPEGGSLPPFRALGHVFHATVAALINYGNYEVVVKEVKKADIEGEVEENVAAVLRMFPLEHAMSLIKSHPAAQAEVAYAFDPRTNTARVLGKDIERKYVEHGLLEHEIPGSADVVWLESDAWPNRNDITVVHDWKVVFGRGAHIEDPKTSAQLHCLALCAMKAEGTKRARVQYCVVNENGDDDLRCADITLLEATVTMKRVLRAVASAADSHPIPGKHCVDMYCPMLPSCPAIQSCVVDMYRAHPHSIAGNKMPITIDPRKIKNDQHAAYLLTVAKQVSRVSDMVLEACKGYVRKKGDPIELSEATEWGPVRTTRTAIHGPSVESLVSIVAPFMGEGRARAVVMAGVTKKALDREIANHSPRGMFRANIAACMEALSNAGMVTVVSDGERFEERKKAEGEGT